MTKPASARSNPSKLDTGFDNATRRVKSRRILSATGGSGPDHGTRRKETLYSGGKDRLAFRTLGGCAADDALREGIIGIKRYHSHEILLIVFRYRWENYYRESGLAILIEAHFKIRIDRTKNLYFMLRIFSALSAHFVEANGSSSVLYLQFLSAEKT